MWGSIRYGIELGVVHVYLCKESEVHGYNYCPLGAVVPEFGCKARFMKRNFGARKPGLEGTAPGSR